MSEESFVHTVIGGRQSTVQLSAVPLETTVKSPRHISPPTTHPSSWQSCMLLRGSGMIRGTTRREPHAGDFSCFDFVVP